MTLARLLPALVISLSAGAVADTAKAAESCGVIFQEARALHEGAPLGDLKDLYGRALAAGDCDDAFRRALGRRVAARIVGKVEKEIAAGAALSTQKAALEESLTYGRLWQVLATLGDIAREARGYGAAAKRYQEALDAIADRGTTRKAPPERVIARIFTKAEETRLLAPDYVETPVNRAGEPAGLAALKVRGFVPTAVAVPVTFAYNSTDFAAKGEAAAADMLRYLKAQGSPDIRLIGHTDPRGSDAYNQDLSLRRAAALQKFLRERGYEGFVQSDGRGEAEPFEPDDPGRYNQEELWQMSRRVELVR